ncbi:hypothetical protein DOTSEDRAFT_27233 [Dothistroma septosporum NZE10]|uniref:Uncharacterized protein n=1 Tax=Dothistroma septosporum (strain NZE10 / CBS 128990) TaxID=675120 RepID=N1PER6_DOTSN|nr:hypothetical protein DOTSEDRAFT_27233 [Dothistroma septosporum NZE10]
MKIIATNVNKLIYWLTRHRNGGTKVLPPMVLTTRMDYGFMTFDSSNLSRAAHNCRALVNRCDMLVNAHKQAKRPEIELSPGGLRGSRQDECTPSQEGLDT